MPFEPRTPFVHTSHLPPPEPPMRRLSLLALLLATLPLAASAAPPEDQWFTVLLDGRKIGSFESKREVHGHEVHTTQTLQIELERNGVKVALGSSESATETLDGQPLAFASTSRLSGSETRIEGRVRDGVVELDTSTGGATQHRRMAWPEKALLPEGLRLAGLRAGLAAGTRYSALAFQPSSLDAAEITSTVGAFERVDLPGGARTLHAVEQVLAFPGAPMKTRAWIDADQTVHKLTLPMMGVELVLLACDRACATAPNQGSDVFARTLMPSPRALHVGELAGTMRYTLASPRNEATLALPDTDEQSVVVRGNERIVTIDREAHARKGEKPAPSDYKPNDWLQSDAPEIVALAKQAAGDAATPLERMRRVETFVRGYIRSKTLDVGYASALEVARKPEGDCTEHALLVAALGRALGIATRVVDGLAYAPGFAGKDQVFVPHAWAQAWVDGRWRSFDAALPGFDAGHIALGIGDGDPWRFYAGLDLLGRIELREAQSLAR
ncbi:transglutaminase superfamily protein [Dokdonella fugitiva]|uniref:Transglutaminase superfamily protein n=2 Tax=Dokdonella fugitiva TaxID=328517 RepID=A0A4R2I7T2_9GAMM|nr:transglutaminase superfamily protein [Dokdonella fugitiva]